MKEVRKKNGVVNIITEDSFEDKTSNFYETPKAFLTTPQEDPHLDSSRRYASEHEQELKVKPEKMENIEIERQRLKDTWIQKDHSNVEQVNALLKTPMSKEASLEDLIRRPEVRYDDLMKIEGLGPAIADKQAAEQIEIQTKYAGYIDRQLDEIAKKKRNEDTLIPVDFDYTQLSGLSNEVVAKLQDARPETIGKASRISGITPAAISLLLVYLKKHGLLSKKIA